MINVDIFVIGEEVRAAHPLSTDPYTLLGKYETTERAICVVDDIEFKFGSQTIYRMPKK
jgi:hypothetical protein